VSKDFSPPRSNLLSRREVVTGLAMLGAAGVAVARKPSIPINYLGAHKLEDAIPKRIGRWDFVTNSGLVVAPEDQLVLAVYSQLLTRVYYDGKAPIWLLIAYSADQTGFLQVHRPEFCYTAAGYELSDFAPHQINLDGSTSITTNSLTAVRADSTEKLIYWTRIGNHIPLSWAQQKLTVAEDNLQRLIPDAALVRISTIGIDEATAMKTMDEFVRSMLASVPPPLKRVFIA
jgi:EpsI family protein